MLILLFGAICALVYTAAFKGEDVVSSSYSQRLFMESTPFLFLAESFIQIICGPGLFADLYSIYVQNVDVNC